MLFFGLSALACLFALYCVRSTLVWEQRFKAYDDTLFVWINRIVGYVELVVLCFLSALYFCLGVLCQ